MELQNIGTETTWNEAAGRINSNNAKVQTELIKLGNATYKHKGYFKSLPALQAAYPTASLGSLAYVGTYYPFAIFHWDGAAWVTDGTTGGDENLDLSQYYTKEEVDAAIASYIEVLPQSSYDELESYESKFYATTD